MKVNGMEFTYNAENGEFTIKGKVPENPPLSSTEKNFLLASTKGNRPTGEEFNGEEIYLSVNMYAAKSEIKKKTDKAEAVKPKKK